MTQDVQEPLPAAQPSEAVLSVPVTRWRRVARAVSILPRFVGRRPLRSLAVVAALAAAAAAGFWGYFQYHLRAAREAVSLGHNAVATRHLRACQWVRPEDPEVLLLASRVARRSGTWVEAESLLDAYWARYGDDDALVLERLLLRATRGETEGTTQLLVARVARDDPASPLAREALVTGLLYRFRWGDADRFLDDWLKQAPDDPVALLLRGKLQEQREQTTEALGSFRRVLEVDPEQDEARMRLAAILLQLRQGEEAVAHLGYLNRRLPDHPGVQAHWARALALQGRTDEARAALDDCLRAHPHNAAALAERGRIAGLDADNAAAVDYLRLAVRLDPGNLATRYQYTLALTRDGKPDESAREQNTIRQMEADATRINELIRVRLLATPNDPAVHHEIATIALRAGRPEEAVRWFMIALQADPDYAPTHRALAGYYQQIDNPVLAAKHRALSQRSGSKPAP
ncbi:tetratricopeptide repeat protein [Fimbriiglobus ruber]|uniref:TPR repeat protein n=1 Tax=Fimbriiglobus ruber TaxID=1908690 RepID=A0A225DFK2_9BACT|nr:tetratricopeptide repeat protein [Fimbriiglobus ruber]OWK39753.1 TPR repeat protein [Fimbriiglobus ruber]